MTKHLCRYAIVRFAPFVETGEFANVGIVMLGPQHRFFDFKLLVYRYARVTRFFEQTARVAAAAGSVCGQRAAD